jgi:hypothetical protein
VLIANWWVVPFTILILGFPSGRLSSWLTAELPCEVVSDRTGAAAGPVSGTLR